MASIPVSSRSRKRIAHMSNPRMIASERVEIDRPTHAWECNHTHFVNEGPQVLVRGGWIHVVYSASRSWTDVYCLGRITARADSNLLDPASWIKHPEPLFASANGLYGPGHCSFTTSPDNAEDWIIYHVAKHAGAGWNREIRMQRFTWNEDDTPKLGLPVAPTELIAVPSGER